LAIGRDDHVEAALPQSAEQEVLDLIVILDEQDSHVISPAVAFSVQPYNSFKR
jgi:hypothetical protein